MDLRELIRTVPDFPEQGIMFKDITTLLQHPDGFKHAIEKLYEVAPECDVVVGIESRGFIFGSVLAHRMGVGFVPIRKAGKLPHKTIREEYELEYGKEEIEIHADGIKPSQRVLIVDDLLATGGTARAAKNLVEKAGGRVVGFLFLVELEDLKGREKLEGCEVFSLVKF